MAQYACEKATQLGAKVVTLSDSSGYIYDPKGIDADKLAYVMELKTFSEAASKSTLKNIRKPPTTKDSVRGA